MPRWRSRQSAAPMEATIPPSPGLRRQITDADSGRIDVTGLCLVASTSFPGNLSAEQFANPGMPLNGQQDKHSHRVHHHAYPRLSKSPGGMDSHRIRGGDRDQCRQWLERQ